jgi:quercetin 2,3-dioxygenase
MTEINRRHFLSVAGTAAASGLFGWTAGPARAFAGPQQAGADFPDIILNPVEVSGAEAMPIIGRLPGAQRMYTLSADQGECVGIGGHVLSRMARAIDTGGVYELLMFTGRDGAVMPRHLHRGSHAALLVLGGDVELELDGRTWRMLRGDFANIPPGTPHGWTLRSDRSQIALYTMGNRAGAAFAAMGSPQSTNVVGANPRMAISGGKLADASSEGDFQLVPSIAGGTAERVSNLVLPSVPGPYVLLDGGGERFGGNTFLARNPNTTGQFLFIMTEGGPGGGVGAHFHARHFENFLGVDGETLGWAYGKAVSLTAGVYFQAPPRNLHGFRLNQAYNRFAAFLSPGIFEPFFTRGGRGQNGVGRQAQPEGGGRGRGPGGPQAGAPRGGARPGGAGGPGGNDMFRSLMMSGRGPDGFPLDVHGPTLPLPPQDPIWLQGRDGAIAERAALLAHALAICGATTLSREITPELRRILSLKPRAEQFI